MESWYGINQGEIHIPRSIKIRRSISLIGVIGVLVVGKEGAASIGGSGIKGSGPGEVQLTRDTVYVAHFEGRLQAVVVRVPVIIQLQNVVVLRKLSSVWLP